MEIQAHFEDIIHSHNVYVDTDFNKYNITFLKYMLYLLEEYNILSPEMSINSINITKYLIELLKNRKITIPSLTFVIEQVSNDFRLVNNVKSVFQDFESVKPYIHMILMPENARDILGNNFLEVWNTVKYLFGDDFIRPF